MDSKDKKSKTSQAKTASPKMYERPQLTPPQRLKKDLEWKNDLSAYLRKADESRRRSWISVVTYPALTLLASFILMSFESIREFIRLNLFRAFEYDLDYNSQSFYLYVVIFGLVLALIKVFIAHETFRYRRSSLIELDTEIERLSLSLPDKRLKFLRQRYLTLSGESLKTRWIDSNRRYFSEILKNETNDMLSNLESLKKKGADASLKYDWDDVQIKIGQWDDLLKDEDNERKEANNWKLMSIGIALLYLVLIILALPIFNSTLNVFGVPFPIILWSGLGSFTAILYRFYNAPERIKFEIEFRRLVARPIIGIVMGTLSYLALVSSALIFSATPVANPSADLQAAGQNWQYWIVAFLGGFSDKFYEKIIELLTSKFTSGKDENQGDNSKEKSEDKVNSETSDEVIPSEINHEENQ